MQCRNCRYLEQGSYPYCMAERGATLPAHVAEEPGVCRFFSESGPDKPLPGETATPTHNTLSERLLHPPDENTPSDPDPLPLALDLKKVAENFDRLTGHLKPGETAAFDHRLTRSLSDILRVLSRLVKEVFDLPLRGKSPGDNLDSVEAALEDIIAFCDGAQADYEKYIRPGFERTDFNGFCAGVIFKARAGIKEVRGESNV